MVSLFNTQALCSPLCLTVDNSKTKSRLTVSSCRWTTVRAIYTSSLTLHTLVGLLFLNAGRPLYARIFVISASTRNKFYSIYVVEYRNSQEDGQATKPGDFPENMYFSPFWTTTFGPIQKKKIFRDGFPLPLSPPTFSLLTTKLKALNQRPKSSLPTLRACSPRHGA